MKLLSKILLIIILILGLNSIILAGEHDKKNTLLELDEDLPKVNPFSGGSASSGMAGGSYSQESEELLSSLKLVGILSSNREKIAIFTSADGRSVQYKENDIINPNLMILDIFKDRIYFKSYEENYTVDMNNIIVKVKK